MTSPAPARPLRMCDSCLLVDDHPRHVYALAGTGEELQTYTDEQRQYAAEQAGGDSGKVAALLRDLTDTATSMKHLECCLKDGCPDNTCDRRAADPADPFDGGKTTGDALVKKLEAFASKSTAQDLPGGVPPLGLNDPAQLRAREEKS